MIDNHDVTDGYQSSVDVHVQDIIIFLSARDLLLDFQRVLSTSNVNSKL